MAPWRKKLAIFFLTLMTTWIVPPNVVAYELAKADRERHSLFTGTLVPDYQTVTAAEISRQQARLAALAAGTATSRDEMLGEALRGLGLSYWHQLDRFNQVTAGNLGVAITRVPSMLKVSWDLNVSDQFGLPYSASIDRIKLNIIRDYNVPVAISADKLAGEKQFAFTSALTGTALEHNVLAQPFAGEAASAARVIQQANNLNKKVFTVTAANVNTIVPLLDLPAAIINDIRNAVNANIEVTVPESSVLLNGIEYFAYVKRDIDTSASEFYLDSRGGEMQNAALKATDLLLDGSAEAYKNVARPLADWLSLGELRSIINSSKVSECVSSQLLSNKSKLPAKPVACSRPGRPCYRQPDHGL